MSSSKVDGQPTARLVHVGVAGLHAFGAGRGWPDGIHIVPFGQNVAPGQVDIAFAITGSKIGTRYSTAGIRVTYRDDSGEHSTVLWSAVVACVVTNIRTAPCNSGTVFDQVRAAANS